MNSTGVWKSRIESTIDTNSRINALLNEPKSFTTAVRQKHLLRSKDNNNHSNCTSQDAQHYHHHQHQHLRKPSAANHIVVDENAANALEQNKGKLVNGSVNVEHIKRLLEQIVEDQLQKENFFRTYNSPISAKFCQILSREVLEQIKDLHLDGYRFVCFVSIIEKFNQTIDVMMKANGKTRGDCYATYTHEAATFFLVLFVYFVE